MAQLSGMVQTFGYPIAATGPVIAAALHGWSGGWTWPLGFVLALLLLNGFIGLRGGRDHVIGVEGV
jgi:CP family cyanate transporter-like MFS transporter